MSDLESNPDLPSVSSPREIARQTRIDVLRRAGYDEQRLAALETESSPPEVPNDLIVDESEEAMDYDDNAGDAEYEG